MSNEQDIVSGRLAQAQGILSCLLNDGQYNNLVSRDLDNTLWAIDTLLHQASEALKEMPYVSKPGATVIISDGDDPSDLQEESLGVIREVVKDLEDALICPRILLNAVDRRDKAAANEAPGGEA